MFADATGHGTALAGIIGTKDNGEGIRGIYPEAELYSIQVLDENNQTTLSQVNCRRVLKIYWILTEEIQIMMAQKEKRILYIKEYVMTKRI